MIGVKTSEKVELGLIAATTGLVALVSPGLPGEARLGYVVLGFGLLFLVQTLLRDLWIMWQQRHVPRNSMPAARCACLESIVGFAPVIASLALLSSGRGGFIPLSAGGWVATTAVVMLAGFVLKDFVLEWKPLRIRREPDHVNWRFSIADKAER